MPKPIDPSSNPRIACLTVLLALLFIATGCEKPKELNTEAVALNAQLEQLKREEGEVEDELLKVTRSNAANRDNAIVRKAGTTIDQKKESMALEISTLNARKTQLENEIEFLVKQASSYRQKYL